MMCLPGRCTVYSSSTRTAEQEISTYYAAAEHGDAGLACACALLCCPSSTKHVNTALGQPLGHSLISAGIVRCQYYRRRSVDLRWCAAYLRCQ